METLSPACSLPYWPNTRRALTWSIRFRLESTVSSATSNRCSARSSLGARRRSASPGEADLLLGVCGWQARCTKEPAARRSSVVLRAGTPGVLGANDVEPVKRVHKRFQEARSGSSVQGDGQVGRISQSIACMIPAVPLRFVTPRAGSAALHCRRIWSSQLPRSPFSG